ncbi:hypothetical protein CRYUN_Cryun06bG0103500 [Craigia yunnanensis]
MTQRRRSKNRHQRVGEQNPTQQPSVDISSGNSSSSISSGDSSDIDDSLLSYFRPNVGQNKRNSDESGGSCLTKKPKIENSGFALPSGFLAPFLLEDRPEPLFVRVPEKRPLSVREAVLVSKRFAVEVVKNLQLSKVSRACKQFWKAGDYEGGNACDSAMSSVGMDHVRVHPKFLHSNATSHKWALGAFAELFDNALDEACNGATYVCIDMLKNQKDGSKILLVEDNGGGMCPDKMRQCMSLGYSSKCKMANTIGQYGNSFKPRTMRLGADVIVFSQSPGKDGKSPTRSIGLLSYTFLTETGKEDIVVPIIDYEQKVQSWTKMTRSFEDDWNRNLETIIQWSPYTSETDLLQQDIQIRGVNRDEKNIAMAKTFHNSRHFLTYRHSLRSYASILHFRLPIKFRMILHGKDIEHHNIVNDMKLTMKITYRPQMVAGKAPTSSDMVASVTTGFVKDAQYHIDVQGFNVYHKNRLIKPFWRVWNAAGNSGRGVLGVLEANFVEPAHDKQGFEHTIVLSRLEAKLVGIQKDYWFKNCHEVGYAARRPAKNSVSEDPSFVSCVREKSSLHPIQNKEVSNMKSSIQEKSSCPNQNGHGTPSPKEKSSSHPTKTVQVSVSGSTRNQFGKKSEQRSLVDEASQDGSSCRASPSNSESRQDPTSNTIPRSSHLKAASVNKDGRVSSNSNMESLIKLKAENHDLRERLNKMSGDLHFEREMQIT